MNADKRGFSEELPHTQGIAKQRKNPAFLCVLCVSVAVSSFDLRKSAKSANRFLE
jgi:hypothetical protein